MKTSFTSAGRAFASVWQHTASKFLLAAAFAAISLASADARTRAFPIRNGTQPIDITMGAADGNFWFTLQNSSEVDRITPDGVITGFRTPTASFPYDITTGPDGNVWFTEGSSGHIAFITPAGVISEISFSPFGVSLGITTGPDGNIWFTDQDGNSIWRYTLATQRLREFPIPTPSAYPSAITAGPDGNLWFTEQAANKIGRITTSGVITEFDGVEAPASITDGPDGNVWFTLAFSAQVGKITPTGDVTLFPIPSAAFKITRARGNTLLFTEFSANRFGQITTDGVVTESPIVPGSAPTGITMGLGRAVWFLGYGSNTVYTASIPR